MPGWVAPTVAISLAVIALSFVVMAAGLALLARRTAQETRKLSGELAELRHEIAPAVQAANRLAEAGTELSSKVKEEVLAILDASRRVRRRVLRGVRRVQGRLEDLDALYEVVHGEVQDTALDVAAALRTARRGAGMLGRLRRLLVRGRR